MLFVKYLKVIDTVRSKTQLSGLKSVYGTNYLPQQFSNDI